MPDSSRDTIQPRSLGLCVLGQQSFPQCWDLGVLGGSPVARKILVVGGGYLGQANICP